MTFYVFSSNYLGLVQGMVNGIRGLCNGLGPALFGFIFYLFNVDLGYSVASLAKINSNSTTSNINSEFIHSPTLSSRDIPGPPFLFGAFLATIALMFSLLLPNSKSDSDSIGNELRTIEHNARLLSDSKETKDSVQIN